MERSQREIAKEIADAATPGPWTIEGIHILSAVGTSEERRVCADIRFMRKVDRAFVTAARHDLPQALSALEQLLEAVAAYRDAETEAVREATRQALLGLHAAMTG